MQFRERKRMHFFNNNNIHIILYISWLNLYTEFNKFLSVFCNVAFFSWGIYLPNKCDRALFSQSSFTNVVRC